MIAAFLDHRRAVSRACTSCARTITALFLMTCSSVTWAHTTPAEFAEMSLQDLLAVDVFEDQDAGIKPRRWSFAYSYRYLEIEGYRDGTDDLSRSEVLFEPGAGEPRTRDNFPVLPTEIEQEIHVLDFSYQISSDTGLRLSVPYISQSTDHISIVPGYPEFLIKSRGIGDIKFSYVAGLGELLGGQLRGSAGISLPTGSIDEEGDTPRAAGDQQLPYTMQLGSGTYDVPLSLSFVRPAGKSQMTLGLSAVIRTGKNDRSYRLGNSYSLSSRFDFPNESRFEPYVATEFRYIAQIDGQDDELIVPNPQFPYPASITNPDLYGGTSGSVKLGVNFKPTNREQNFSLELSAPIYQHLNGPQPRGRWSASARYQFTL